MSNLMSIGLTGLNANSAALSTTGNNITNANTPGYSRESTVIASQTPESTGSYSSGTGVSVQGVVRQVNTFAQSQLLSDTSQSSQLTAYSTALSRINNYVAGASTSVSTQIQTLFNDMQTALSNPSSVTSRQVAFSDMQTMVNTFNASAGEVASENQSVNSTLTSNIQQINALAQSIAKLNVQLAGSANLPTAQQPNSLLDSRDQLLQQLSQLVSVSVVNDGTGVDNVFIGNGQALVVGAQASALSTQPAAQNAAQQDITIASATGPRVITSTISGGSVGGLLGYQQNVLGSVQNTLGQMAMVLSNAMNSQNKLGVDLSGSPGINLFSDINSTAATTSRITSDNGNPSPQTYGMNVSISSTSQLTNSDYVLAFTGPGTAYTLTRSSDSKVVAQGNLPGSFPTAINADGFSINLTSGNFVAGAKFYVSPTRQGASSLAMNVTTPSQLALAWPVTTSNSVTNQGNATISVAGVTSTSTPTFTTKPGAMSPPLLVRFTSATTYDVLNNSNPASPSQLVPPVINQTYNPGGVNTLFSTDPGQTQVSSTGALAGVATATATNGYPAETLNFNVYNAATGSVTPSSITTTANESAGQIAQAMNTVTGVKAVANTQAVLSGFVNSGTFSLSLNGQTLTGTTPDALAASINASGILAQAGIQAASDGTHLTVRSVTGADLSFSLGGAASNSVSVQGSSGAAQVVAGGGTSTVGGIINTLLPGSSNLTTTGLGLFTTSPVPQSTYQGYTLNISGVPVTGDTFTVGYNSNAAGDARNGQAMLALQNANNVNNGTMSVSSLYGSMVQSIGTQSAQAQSGQQAATTVLQNTTQLISQVSGVNLNEEAANLIQYQQAYTASAQVINTARTIFNSLLTAVGA